MRIVLKELFAVLIVSVLLILTAGVCRIQLGTLNFQEKPIGEPHYEDIYRANDYSHIDNAAADKRLVLGKMQRSLESGAPVVFATSELTGSWAVSESKFIPHAFFKNEIEVPVFTFGRAHAQSLTVLSQLAAFSNESMNQNARVAFVISPAFFRTDGTNIEAFLDYMPGELLKKLYFESNAPEDVKVYIGRFVKTHLDKIKNPSFIHKYAASYQSLNGSDGPIQFLSASLNRLKNRLYYVFFDESYDFSSGNKSVFPDLYSTIPSYEKIDWEGYEEQAKKISIDISSNNPWGIRNDYFDYYVKEESNNAQNKINVPIPEWDESKPGLVWRAAQYESIEYSDLKMLMDFCAQLKHKPLFIMQDINPLAYKNYEKHNFNMKRIKELAESYGYPYLDLWSYSPDNYVKGTLVDIMHMGEYGWLQVDKAIYQYLIEAK